MLGCTVLRMQGMYRALAGRCVPASVLLATLVVFAPLSAAQQTQDVAVMLHTIQGLESLRYEILYERDRFNASPAPVGEAALQTWRAVAEDIKATLTEIEAALADVRQRYRDSGGAFARAPPASDMPPLLPE
jgi:predicted alpha/beta-hydrolase family hydrolase